MDNNKKTKVIPLGLKKPGVENEKKPKNPSEYGYREGQTIEVEARVFMGMVPLLQKFEERGIETRLRAVTKEDGEGLDKEATINTRTQTITEESFMAGQFVDFIIESHRKAVEDGTAIHMDELNQTKPAEFKIDKVEKVKEK